MSDRSRIPGFYRLPMPLRHARLAERFDLNGDELAALSPQGGLALARADKMVENCIGTFSLPIGLGLNFRINGQDYAVPMVVEEPSVVAAVSNTALLVREAGGFEADADPALMIGQVQLVDVPDLEAGRARVLAARERLLHEANALQPGMRSRHQGARELEVHVFHEPTPMLVVHLVIDCGEAMGANAINSMAEGIAPSLEELTGGNAVLRILSNLADRRLARARCAIPEARLADGEMTGPEVAERIVHAYALAAVDPYRAATHNKGVMNGVDAVAIATGNDWRSVEAGAHAFAARSGAYRPSVALLASRRAAALRDRAAHGGGQRGRQHAGAPHGGRAAQGAGRERRARAGRGHGRGGAGAEPGGPAGARHGGHPARAHAPARAQHRHLGRGAGPRGGAHRVAHGGAR
jgi:hydroxymethylglutaryl-CoA reductase